MLPWQLTETKYILIEVLKLLKQKYIQVKHKIHI